MQFLWIVRSFYAFIKRDWVINCPKSFKNFGQLEKWREGEYRGFRGFEIKKEGMSKLICPLVK